MVEIGPLHDSGAVGILLESPSLSTVVARKWFLQPVVLLVAKKLLSVVAEDASELPGVDAALFALPHAPDKVPERPR